MLIGCHCSCQYLILLLAQHQHRHPSCFCNPAGYRPEYRTVHSPYTGRMAACIISCICRRGNPGLCSELVLLSSNLSEVLHRHPMTSLCSPVGLVPLDLPAVGDARWQPVVDPCSMQIETVLAGGQLFRFYMSALHSEQFMVHLVDIIFLSE